MSIKNNILDKIKKDHIEPISKSAVLRRKYLIIALLILLIGLWVFIVSFFISDMEWLGELVELDTIYIIFLWILAIILLWVFIYRDARYFGTFYRYNLKKALGIIFGTMFFGWLLLHISGIDHSVQKFLIRYTGYEEIMVTYANWSKPEQWKLIGEITKIWKDGIVIKDLHWKDWKILLSEDILMNKGMKREGDIEVWDTIKVSWRLQGDGVFMGETTFPLFE